MRSCLLQVVSFLLVAACGNALKILLTSEDGIDAEGLLALRAALLEDDHKVWTVAPAADVSGNGAALDMPNVTVTQAGEKASDKMWSVDGYASTAVLVGLTIMYDELLADNPTNVRPEPDLVRYGWCLSVDEGTIALSYLWSLLFLSGVFFFTF